MRSFLRYWLPVVAWAGLIFFLSTEAGSPRHTSRIIGPILRWFKPDVSDRTIQRIQFYVRKVAHFTEYAVLAWLLWRARRKPQRADPRPWDRREALRVFLLAALFAASDEWHQTFVPTREGSPIDVALDSTGALAGLGMARWLYRRRESSPEREQRATRGEDG